MNRKNTAWVDADKLIEQSHPDAVLQHFGLSLPDQIKGNNYRINCLIDGCESNSYGKLSIELSAPYRIQCFSCGVRGNLFDLVWIAKHGKAPTGNKLRGAEFVDVRNELQGIVEGNRNELRTVVSREQPNSTSAELQPNTPLLRSDNERIRSMAELWKEGITDPQEMSPAASRYWRQREFFNDLCEKWGISYLPSNASGTLRGRVVYRIDSVAGQALAYAGRDPDFDAKLATWTRKKKGNEPIKTRFPSEKYFRKGLEFYGQQVDRLQEPGYSEAISNCGVLIVEGMNDVLALDHKNHPAIGAMSNRLTDAQVKKAVRFACQTSGKITLMFDRNEAGQTGQQDAMAILSEHVPVLNGWTGYTGDASEPEELSPEEWTQQKERIQKAWRNATSEAKA